MGIAGGLSLAGIGMLEDAGLRRFPLAFQMMVSAVLITAIELYSGMFSLRVLHYRMWDSERISGLCMIKERTM